MGYDLKYGKVTVEKVRNRPIADDEPVVVFRAQDRLLPSVLTQYWHLAEAAGSPKEHLDLINDARLEVAKWQGNHPTQTPGSDEL